MIGKALFILFVSLCVGAVLGIVTLFGESGLSRSANDTWRASPVPSVRDQTDPSIAQILIDSGHFKIGAEEIAISADNQDDDENAQVSSPTLVAKSALDDEEIITVRLASGVMRSIRVGDVLEDGWQVAEVTPQAVIFELEGERYTVPFFGY